MYKFSCIYILCTETLRLKSTPCQKCPEEKVSQSGGQLNIFQVCRTYRTIVIYEYLHRERESQIRHARTDLNLKNDFFKYTRENHLSQPSSAKIP